MQEDQNTVAVVVALTAALLAVVFAVVIAALLAGPVVGQGAACLEWSDGCAVCSRTPQGLACSTPGVACTPGPVRCLRP